MKSIGKPCTGEPYARFDEGGQGRPSGSRLGRDWEQAEPVLYSERHSFGKAGNAFYEVLNSKGVK